MSGTKSKRNAAAAHLKPKAPNETTKTLRTSTLVANPHINRHVRAEPRQERVMPMRRGQRSERYPRRRSPGTEAAVDEEGHA